MMLRADQQSEVAAIDLLLMGLLLIGLLLGAGCGSQGAFPWPLRGRGVVAQHAEVRTLNGAYRRDRSRVLVRRIARATRANLDYAAYVGNALLRREHDERLGPPATVPPAERLFGGVLVPGSIVATLAETPLTSDEMQRPLAFAPLTDHVARWSAERAAGLERARAAVAGEHWGLQGTPGVAFQQIVSLYLHRQPGGAVQLWVEIELEPWARLFTRLPDGDGDGVPEVYAQLRGALADAAVVRFIEQDYAGKELDAAAVRTWANELASYWYPSYNTDVVDLGASPSWPAAATEADVRAELAGLSVPAATAVIRGKPHGQPMYNVFVVPNMPWQPASTTGTAAQPALDQIPVAADPGPVEQAIAAELQRHGGTWSAWLQQARAERAGIQRALRRRPKALKALIGRDGWLFYRKSLEYVVGGDLQAQPPGKNPFPVIVAFKQYLARLGVDFLLVPIPTKAEVFPDMLPGGKRRSAELPVVNPHGRKLLHELARAGVEVVDLLPLFLAARAQRQAGEEPVYQPQDTHWTDRGLRLAAAAIGQRIQRYGWYPRLQRAAGSYALKPVRFQRHGDLHSRLAPGEQRRFRAASLVGHQVLLPDGKLYDDDPASPIVMLGDSFTGVYQRTDCEHAGISAHVARAIGHPVDLVMSYGGGPNVRRKLLTRGEDDLRRKRLLIWLFAARDLFDYWEDWEPLQPGRAQ